MMPNLAISNLGKHSAKIVTIRIVKKILKAILGLEMNHECYIPSSNKVMRSHMAN